MLGALGVLGVAMPILQACGSGTPSAPASAPTAASSTSSSTASTSATAAPKSQAAPSGGKVAMSIATYAGPSDQWQRDWAKTWAGKNPDVNLTIAEVNYNSMAQKQIAELATGTMQDVVFSGIKWFPFSAAKGAFLQIDDYVKTHDPGLSDFFSAALSGASFDGKLLGLPYLLHPGNPALIAFNKDMLEQKGAKIPTDDWTVQDYLDLAIKTTDTKNKIFGTNYFPTGYYDFCSLARTWGGDDMSADGKKFTFATDPKSVEAAQWAVNLRSKYKVAPSRAEAQGLEFPAGRLATSTAGTYSILSLGKTVGTKFKWDVVLFPKGPTGLRGYQGFVECFSIYAKSKQPERAYDLIVTETSKEAGIYAVVKDSYQPTGRKSVWAAPEIAKISSIFARALKWMSDTKGPFPMPYNLRFTELEDKWENTSQSLFYGEVPFQQGIQAVQKACQAIMDEPQPS